MKFGIVGDIHLTDSTPENRTDGFPSVQNTKLNYIFQYFRQQDIDFVLCPGDLFDHHSSPDVCIVRLIKLLREYGIHIVMCPGQHDLRYHSSPLENTPIGILLEAGFASLSLLHSDLAVQGAGWGKDIPCSLADHINVLLTHRMIIADRKLWDGQKEYDLGSKLLRTSGYDLIVSGDNHQGFSISVGDKHLINCGSLMRSKVDQINHLPRFAIWDSETKELQELFVPIAPAEKVFNLKKVEEKKEKEDRFKELMDKLKKGVSLRGMDFRRNMVEYVKGMGDEIDERTKQKIEQVMEEA